MGYLLFSAATLLHLSYASILLCISIWPKSDICVYMHMLFLYANSNGFLLAFLPQIWCFPMHGVDGIQLRISWPYLMVKQRRRECVRGDLSLHVYVIASAKYSLSDFKSDNGIWLLRWHESLCHQHTSSRARKEGVDLKSHLQAAAYFSLLRTGVLLILL